MESINVRIYYIIINILLIKNDKMRVLVSVLLFMESKI